MSSFVRRKQSRGVGSVFVVSKDDLAAETNRHTGRETCSARRGRLETASAVVPFRHVFCANPRYWFDIRHWHFQQMV